MNASTPVIRDQQPAGNRLVPLGRAATSVAVERNGIHRQKRSIFQRAARRRPNSQAGTPAVPVAQVSKPAVSPISKSARAAAFRAGAAGRGVAGSRATSGFGNPRYSRLGSLRYAAAVRAPLGARRRARSINRSRLAQWDAADSDGWLRGFGAAAVGPPRTQPRSLGGRAAAGCSAPLCGPSESARLDRCGLGFALPPPFRPDGLAMRCRRCLRLSLLDSIGSAVSVRRP